MSLTTLHQSEAGGVVLFDGVCNLCNATVDFIMRHDGAGYFRFTSLQSVKGRELLEGCGKPTDDFSSVVLVEGGKCYTRSHAAMRILKRLDFPWNLLYGIRIVPAPFREWGYRFISHHRYEWFGKRDTCRIPTPEEQARFLG